ncbi:MAG: AraC family transcriptional regulator [Cellvibrionaceae bacterium]
MTQLATLLQSYADLKSLNQLGGSCRTAIKGVRFFRAAEGNGREPLLYQSGILMVGQGNKEIHLGDQCVRYGAGDYLVVGVPLPLECEAFSDEGKPILGLSLNVSSETLHRLVNQVVEHGVDRRQKASTALGLTSETMDQTLNDAFVRLVQALHEDRDAAVLGENIVEEIVYRVLTGSNGHVLFNLASHDGQYARIAKTLTYLHREFATNITVESLAQQANMSVSGFHRAFREVTAESPLQYLKKVRLTKAKDLIVAEGRRVNEVAERVGYSSTSQFSREFKRHFNVNPKACA